MKAFSTERNTTDMRYGVPIDGYALRNRRLSVRALTGALVFEIRKHHENTENDGTWIESLQVLFF